MASMIPTIFSELYTVALFFSSLLLLKFRVLLRSLPGSDPPADRSDQNRVSSIEANFPAAPYCSDPKSAAECAVCLSDFRKGESVMKLDCKHVFHRDCLDRWLTSPAGLAGPSCPLCRTRLALPAPEGESGPVGDCGGGEWGRREMLTLLAKFREEGSRPPAVVIPRPTYSWSNRTTTELSIRRRPAASFGENDVLESMYSY